MAEAAGRRKLGVVGDDLQGSNLCGACLAASGMRAIVAPVDSGGTMLETAEVPVLNVASRLQDPAEAYARVQRACRRLMGLGCTHLYKFSDSAARGHLGIEVDAVLDELGVERAVFALAQPLARRLTVGGYQIDDGRPVSESNTGRDLLQPVSQSHLPSLLTVQSRRRVGLVPLTTVQKGVEAIAEALKTGPEQLLVVDSATQRHLTDLARALALSGMDRAVFGSAGLVGELPAALGLDRRATRPVLVLCGSANPIAISQVQTLADSGRADLVRIHARGLADTKQTVPPETEMVLQLLRAGRNVAVMVAVEVVPNEDGVAKLPNLVGAALARIAWEAAADADLVVFGGDTAQWVLDELGMEALEVVGEVPVGAVLCRVAGGPLAGRYLITKSGAGAGPNTLLEAVQVLRNQSQRT